ncbi:MAG: sn-glycerol-3-phosphate ABC transporter ATP-binding protein UgpC [Actinomycetaceae bacterium]|nr:sn-glycerol-3-phosphate ABC transporter ATP-binding protein UgpC [Actinomycetaceae bacterium]
MASVTFENATRTFSGATKPAVDSLNLHIEDGECVVLVGPSGCGKSTSLRMVAGLEPTTSGHIMIGDKDMTGVRPRSRDVAMVFQSYALYPNMTVAQNMAFALENMKVSKSEIQERVQWAGKMLELDHLLDRKPSALSGGQRQRVAMGRAIVRKPTVFCMDEPLSNLDAKLRVTMRGEIANLQRSLGVTTVYVTHDQVEAMTMGDRVAVMRDGKLQQVDTPETLYAKPNNAFVAGFIGSPSITLFHTPVDAGNALLGNYVITLPREVAAKAGSQVIVGIRPESWDVVSPSEPGIAIRMNHVELLGSQSFLYGEMVEANGVKTTPERIAILLHRKARPVPGDVIHVRPQLDELHFFDATTQEAIR